MSNAIRMTPEQYEAHTARRLASAAAVKKLDSTKRMQALGRLKAGAMNKTEQSYSEFLEAQKRTGHVVWYKFEGLKFRLADNTFYTPDFVVMLASGQLEAHEVKGFWQDDAKVKIKVAADMYPIRFVAVKVALKKDGGGWLIEEF